MNLKSELLALVNIYKFIPFMKGTTIRLNGGAEVFIKVKQSQRQSRRPGLRFSKYIFQTEIQANEVVATGVGEDSSKLIAFEKSISEGIERVIFRIIKNKNGDLDTTSGWAAHISEPRARKSAIEELGERDALLVHWLLKKPMTEIEPSTFPRQIKRWIENELVLHPSLRELRILTTLNGFVPTITTILESEDGQTVMSHATAPTLWEGFNKSIAETCRLASNLDGLHFLGSSKNLNSEDGMNIHPEDHAMFYSYHEKLPTWLFGEKQPWNYLNEIWISKITSQIKKVDFTFHKIVDGPLCVGYAESKAVQDLYFGSTSNALENGKINFTRLNIGRGATALNMAPHFIS